MSNTYDRTWIWHPTFTETDPNTSGHVLQFCRVFDLPTSSIPSTVPIHITADTRYHLTVNGISILYGPVKGDANLWFYDEIDIAPYLQAGENKIEVRVLRLFYATTYAPSFARLGTGGLRVRVVGHEEMDSWKGVVDGSAEWEVALEEGTTLRINELEDAFLHVYEEINWREGTALRWVKAKALEFKNSTGNAPPWNLAPRMIPQMEKKEVKFKAVRNVESRLSDDEWTSAIVQAEGAHNDNDERRLILPAGTTHDLDLEVAAHATAFIRIRFQRPQQSGAIMRVTYSESYEDEPESVPWTRRKGDRCDFTKRLYGPSDIYRFQGVKGEQSASDQEFQSEEVFAPFHWRTFRFLHLSITTGSTDLILSDITIESVTYPLSVSGSFNCPESDLWGPLWQTSIRTLRNCMHDCYEDCPMYEQLQYAMDTRSSALFTYLISGDDRLARQAIIQIHNSFQARLGLTASRAPSHRQQFIPNFSLYWICMVVDHYEYFADATFVREFTPVIDAILSYFDRRIGSHGLTISENRAGIWNFVDWTPEWKPHGIPPSTIKTGISTFNNMLYAYTLLKAGFLLGSLNRPSLQQEYTARSTSITANLKRIATTGHSTPTH